MEKIKPLLDALKKHHFWMLSGICVVVMLYCWNSASTEIQTQFSANKSKVEGEFNKVQKMSSRSQYPNPKWEEEAKAKGQEVAKQIEAASRRIVSRQQPALNWSDTFSPAFLEVASKKSPDSWPDEAVAEFQLVMPEEVKRLRTIVEAADSVDQPGVQWNQEDYQYILEAFTLEAPPAKRLVMRMRTRFWVFESLAKIIAATNEGAEDKFNLPIHNLDVMAVGGNRVNADPAEWHMDGVPGAGAMAPPPAVAGYEVWPVRLRVRMDLKYLNRMLTACANSQLALDVNGVRFDHPNRSVEVKQEEKPDTRPRFRVGGGFGGVGPPPQQKAEEKEKPKPKPVASQRGTLVEITGYVYIADEQSLKQELAKPDQAAAASPPGVKSPRFAGRTSDATRGPAAFAQESARHET